MGREQIEFRVLVCKDSTGHKTEKYRNKHNPTDEQSIKSKYRFFRRKMVKQHGCTRSQALCYKRSFYSTLQKLYEAKNAVCYFTFYLTERKTKLPRVNSVDHTKVFFSFLPPSRCQAFLPLFFRAS